MLKITFRLEKAPFRKAGEIKPNKIYSNINIFYLVSSISARWYNFLPYKVTIIELEKKMASEEIIFLTVQQITEDINRASLMLQILENSKDVESEALFLKTELLRSTGFPRKGTDFCYELAHNPVILRLDQAWW